MTRHEAVVVHTDGASRGNPGPAAIGVVIADPSGHVLAEFGEALSPSTNNVAEYTAVIRALERALELGARRVSCLMDSQLVVRQLNGSYKVRHAGMLPLYRRVLELIQLFDEVSFEHVPRELNADADRLANRALDGGDAAAPESVARKLFDAVADRRWVDAAAFVGARFQYWRAGQYQEGGFEAFLEGWRRAEQAWSVSELRSFGPDVLLQAVAAGSSKLAILWLCQIHDRLVDSIIEYRDTGR